MARPTYRDRLTASGDLIPASRVPGPGGGANCIYKYLTDSTGDGGSYPAGTRMMGYQHDFTSPDYNRAFWYLASCVDHNFEKEIAMPNEEMFNAGGAGDADKLIDLPVYLGEAGFATADLPRVISVWDNTRNELVIGGARVVVADIRTQVGGGGVTCYPPLGGLTSVNAAAAVIQIVAGVNIVLNPGLGFGIPLANYIGISLLNYSGYMRGVRDGSSWAVLSNNFATIETPNIADVNFDMHRDVGALGWAVGDELYITYFASEVYLNFNILITAALQYIIPYGTYRLAGNIGQDALVNFSIHGGHRMPYELLEMRANGLDGAYDRVTLGPAGSGRVVTVDAGPIEAVDAPVSDASFRAQSNLAIGTGSVGFDAVDRNPDPTNKIEWAGKIIRKLMHFDGPAGAPASDTDIPNTGATCTGDGFGVVTLTAGETYTNGAPGPTSLIPGVDLGWILDAGGDPFNGGLYRLDALDPADATKAAFTSLTHAPVNLAAVIGGTIFIYRPLLISPWILNIGGALNYGSVFSAYNQADESFAQAWFTTVGGAHDGDFLHAFVGNISKDTPVYKTRPAVCPSTAGEFGYHQSYGITSLAGLDAEVFTEYLDRNVGYRRFITRDQYTASLSEFAFAHTGAVAPAHATAQALELFPYGAGVGYMDGTNQCETTVEFGDYTIGAIAGSARIAAYDFAAGAKSVFGLELKAWAGGAGDLLWAVLRESPTVPEVPMDTAVDTNLHRLEVNKDTNIGWSGARTMTKIVNIASAEGDANWQFVGSTVTGDGYWETTTDSSILILPIELPHGASLVSMEILWDNLNVLNPDAQLYLVRNPFVLPTNSTFITLLAAVWMDVPGGVGGPWVATVNELPAPVTEKIDLETYTYYGLIHSGVDPLTTWRRLYGFRVTYTWVDIFPQ